MLAFTWNLFFWLTYNLECNRTWTDLVANVKGLAEMSDLELSSFFDRFRMFKLIKDYY